MTRLIGVSFVAAAAAVALGACAPRQPEFAFRAPPAVRGQTCDTASANVLTFGRANAKLYADIALKHQVADLRGYMFGSGLRRIQLVQQTTDCSPASTGVGANLYMCTARAQMCGR